MTTVDNKTLTDGNQTPAEVRADERWRHQQPRPSLSDLDINVSRSGRNGKKFIISGPDAEAVHHMLSVSYAEPGAVRGSQFVLSQQAQHEANSDVMQVIDELNRRADSKGRSTSIQ